jgi:hypothetical protein
MTCSDVRKSLPEILDEPPATVQAGIAGHLQNCVDCSDLVSDLKLIASESRQLAETEEPPARVWVRIAAELRAEGLIKDEPVLQRPMLVPAPSLGRRWSLWWLAPVAVAILATGTYTISHKPTTPVAKQIAPAIPSVTSEVAATTAPTPAVTSPTPAPKQLAQKESAPTKSSARPVANPVTEAAVQPETNATPNTSADDQQFLSVVSTRVPSMRATYESQLQAVNADIRETEAYVKRFPGDADARQHLMDAYQQKALLYQIALDHIQ